MSDSSPTNKPHNNTSLEDLPRWKADLEDARQFLPRLKDGRSEVAPFRGRLKAALFLGVLCLLLGGCGGDESGGTETSMFRGGVAGTGVYDGSGPEAPVRAAWQFETGDRVRSSPAVAGGTVYVGSNDGHLYAIDAETGQQQWQFETGDDVSSSPAVAGGTVYVGSYDGHLYAIDAETGQQQWQFETWTWGDVRSSPAVAGGTVYVGSDDGHLYALQSDAQ